MWDAFVNGPKLVASKEQLEFFAREGYLLVEDVFPQADVDAISNELAEVIDQCLAKYVEGPTPHADAPFLTRLARIAEDDLTLAQQVIRDLTGRGGGGHTGPAMFAMLRHSKLLDWIQDIVGEHIIGSSVYRIRPKLPNYGKGVVPWHQDSGYLLGHCDARLIVTCWVPLVDANQENGCLQVLPRCHTQGILEHHTGGNAGFLVIRDEDLPAGIQPVTVPVPRGGVLLMTNLTPHCSTPNTTDHIRWSLDLRYQAADVPNNVGLTPQECVDVENPVEVACYPPEADFVIRDPLHPEREVRDLAAFQAIRSPYESTLAKRQVGGQLWRHWKPVAEVQS